MKIVYELCEKHKSKLIYLVKFGSHLYGTNTENSDLDYKGIFLPSLENLVLGRKIITINHQTSDNVTKNNASDIDIELYSLQYWIELVRKGETIALDVLFSYTNENCIIEKHYPMDLFFDNTDKLITTSELAYTKYAIGQAKKYGIKGSRLGVLKKIHKWFCDNFEEDYLKSKKRDNNKLSLWIDTIVDIFGDESYCFVKEIGNNRCLIVCGKVHQGNISMREFYQRIDKAYNEYGHRAKLAEQNKGIDWKAISHAIRAIYQTKQLLTNGKIIFPLTEADILIKIKQGEYPWSEVENLIVSGLDEISNISSEFISNWNQNFVDNLILKTYGLQS
jgi:hypothetical protein